MTQPHRPRNRRRGAEVGVDVSASIVFYWTQVDSSGKRGMIPAVRSDRRSRNPKCDTQSIVELAQLAGR